MTYYTSSQEWLHYSSLLLAARPSTTLITTHYSIKPPRPKKSTDPETLPDAPAAAGDKPPRGRLILKAYDPASGVCLKYKTSKAAEVSRLVQMLGTLGRRQAALPEREEPVPVAVEAEAESGAATPVVKEQATAQGGGGKKGKKKGKR